MNGVQSRHHRDDRLTGNELDQIHPMRSDIGDGPRRTTVLGRHSPIEVGRFEQPILDVPALDVQHLAKTRGDIRTRSHPGGRFDAHRIEANVVGDGGSLAGMLSNLD